MEILNAAVREATKKRFDETLAGKVTLVHFTQEPRFLEVPERFKGQDCMYCRETRALVEEVAALAPEKIELRVCDFEADREAVAEFGIDKIPATVVMGEADAGIRFSGIPSGYEYMSLIEAIVDVSRGATALAAETKTALKALDRDVLIQVFVTPTCPYCTVAVRTAHQMAMESPRVRAEMVEASEFPHLVQRFDVSAVPKTVFNGGDGVEGAVPEAKFLEHVLRAGGAAPVKT